MQPYHRRKNPDLKALAILDELCNIDKHRLLHLTSAALTGSSFGLEATGGPWTLHRIEVAPGPLKRGAGLARFTVEAGPGTRMNVNAHLLLDIVFDQRSETKAVRGKSVLNTLRWIGTVIGTQVMPELAPLLPGDWHLSVENPPWPRHSTSALIHQ